MSISNPYSVPFSFMESFGYIPPSSRYAKMKAGDTTNWDGDSWTDDFLEWLQINGQKFNALMSCPVTDMPDVINAWYYSDDMWTIWYQDYKSQEAEHYTVSALQYEWLKNYYNKMDSKTKVNPTDENSMITSAGVTRALWENMLNTEQETKVENKKIFTIGKDLLNLTNGILMLQKQGIVDAFGRIIEYAPLPIYNNLVDKKAQMSFNSLTLQRLGTEQSILYDILTTNPCYNLGAFECPKSTNAKNIFYGMPPYKYMNGSDIDVFFTNGTYDFLDTIGEYYIHPYFILAKNDTNKGYYNLYNVVLFTNNLEHPLLNLVKSGDSSLVNTDNGMQSITTYNIELDSSNTSIVYGCMYRDCINTNNGKIILSTNTFQKDNWSASGITSLGYSITEIYYLGTVHNLAIYNGLGMVDNVNDSESITMETYDNYPDIAIENRDTLDIDDVTYYKDITAEELQREQREERKILVTDIPDQGVEEWAQDVPIDDTQVQEETGTQTVEKEEENYAILDAINDLANTLDDVIDKPIESTNEPPIISDIPSIEIPSGDTSVKGLFTIWNPSSSQVAGVASYLWSSIFNGDVIDQFKKWFSNPMDAIISLAFYPVIPSSARTGTIKLGAFSTGVSNVKVVDNIFQELDCGTVMLKRKFNNFLDFSPFTKVSIYLPFIGVVPLNTDDVMNSKIHVVYRYEFLTGSCIAKIMISKGTLEDSLLYQYSGNIAMQIPLSGANYSSVYSGIISGLATGISAYASGGVSVAGAVASGSGVALNQSKESLQRSGSLGGNSGMLGQMKPYLIIERPIVDSPSTYNELLGRESNTATTIDKLSGYTEVQNVDVNNIPCTSEEKKMIYDLLMSGFYA